MQVHIRELLQVEQVGEDADLHAPDLLMMGCGSALTPGGLSSTLKTVVFACTAMVYSHCAADRSDLLLLACAVLCCAVLRWIVTDMHGC